MPEVISCPSCNRQLRVPDDLIGQQVKCPTCGSMFTALIGGASASPPPPSSAFPSSIPSRPAPRERDDYDDDDEDDYDDRPRRRRRRRSDYEPHRGATILTLGILSFFICGPIFGPMAWVMGNTDLAKMKSGEMDPEGEGITSAGRICGMIATILSIVAICVYFFVIMAMVGAGGPNIFK
jgi:predicted Zn finger-like uncharacterized protein